MEKINALIDKLQELKSSNADLQSISYYVQLLQAELLHARTRQQSQAQAPQGNIAVIMPAPAQTITITAPSFAGVAHTNGYTNKDNTYHSNNTVAEAAPVSQPVETETVMQPAAIDAGAYAPKPAAAPHPVATPAVTLVEPLGPVEEAAFRPEPAKVNVQPVAVPEAKPAEPAVMQPAAYANGNSYAAQPAAAPEVKPAEPAIIQPAAKVETNNYMPQPAASTPPAAVPEPTPVEPPRPAAATIFEPTPVHRPVTPEPVAVQPAADTRPYEPQPAVPLPEKKPVSATLFEVETAPAPKSSTLRKEINELAAQITPSLNEKLKQSKSEIGERLGDMPVKDLRQAIGINDKFQFIQELFRGDVDMYERSIKTINEFHTLQEAEYWIERELKIRQGWLDDMRAVRHFYTLVKKRFS